MAIALDATYSVGKELSGVGVYSREILFGLARQHPRERFRFCYRPHRFMKGVADRVPSNVSRSLLLEAGVMPGRPRLFHGLNQRMPRRRFPRAVCTFHDLFVLTGEYSTAEFRARFAEQARTAAERSDLIVCVSSFTADQAHQLLNVDRARLRVIHHGVRQLPRHEVQTEPIILTVGAIQHRKNTARLVKAFERLPEPWKLVLAGSPGGFGSPAIMQRIEQSPARSRIQVTGYVTNDELGRWYSRASVFAFPSLDEGFGMPVLEAMAFGLPVIASARSALPEVCGDAAMLVDAEDTDAIADALHRLTSDEVVREQLSVAGTTRARQFTWARAVEQTWAVYRELLG